MKPNIILAFTLFFFLSSLSAQVEFQTNLKADGVGDTYELISSILAPGYDPVEEPDCGHADFGRHIDEVFDEELGSYVFRFFIHTAEDNDRCINFDRQRNEIKSYNQSPDILLATEGEIVHYKWKFKLDADFQSSASFTHLHQIKAVGGPEASMPLITLTTRKGNPDKLELRYAETTNQITLHKVDLTSFKGVWLEVTETILFGEEGSYELSIVNIENGSVLLDYENNSIRTWKTDASFLRPKWGIYRSLNDADNLRDEAVLFADFTIEEWFGLDLAVDDITTNAEEVVLYPNPVFNELFFEDKVRNDYQTFIVYNALGKRVVSGAIPTNGLNMIGWDSGLYFVVLKGKKESTKYVKILKK